METEATNTSTSTTIAASSLYHASSVSISPISSAPSMASILHTVHSVNCGFCFAVGVLLNGLLIWLILNKTAKEMRPYAKIMIQTAVLDICLLFVILIVQPVFIMLEGSNIMLQNGPFRESAQPWNFILSEIWIFGYYFSIVSMVVQFIYRYIVLCHQKTVSTCQHLSMLSVGAAILLGYMAMLYYATFPAEFQPVQIQRAMDSFFNGRELSQLGAGVVPEGLNVFGGREQLNVRISMIGRPDSYKCLVNCAYTVFIEFLCYGLIIFCGFKIRDYVHRQALNLSSSEKSSQRQLVVNRQITNTLVIQATLPLFAMLISVLCVVVCTSSKLLGMYLSMPFVGRLLSTLGRVKMQVKTKRS